MIAVYYKMYKESPGKVHSLAETQVMRSISDGNYGLIIPFVAKNEVYQRDLYILWIDSAGNTKKMSLVDNSPSKITTISDCDFTVYPNPASEEIVISSKNSKQKQIEIYQYTGRIMDIISVKDHYKLDIRSYPKGLYFIKWESATYKFIRE